MRCPSCGVDNDRVIDSRTSQDGFSIRRRRECLACRRRYTTYERLEQLIFKVIKKDGAREPLDPEKMRAGLEKACWKRPVSNEQIRALIDHVEREVRDRFESEVPSQTLGELIMERLRQLDQVAFVRFASVYRQFEDLHDFVDELQPMLKQARKPPD
jgi:transcriptional repressor NrdR